MNAQDARFEKRMAKVMTAFRRQKGMSQAELAAKIGIDQAQVSRMEAGRRHISMRDLSALARAFGVAPADLIQDKVEL